MMQRPVTVTDVKVPRSGNGGGDVFLGVLSGTLEIEPFGEPRRNRRRQRTARTVKTCCRDALCRQAHDIALPDQEVDALIAGTVSAFDEYVARAERQNFARLNFHLPLVAGNRSTDEHRSLRKIGVTTSDRGTRFFCSASTASG